MKRIAVVVLFLLVFLVQVACDDTNPLPPMPEPTPDYSAWEVQGG
jgi:hypothetical protein